MKKIRVGIVNYLNTKPLLYGIDRSPVKELIETIQDYPSNIAKFLLEGKIDMGLVPVAVLPALEEYHINTDYCIGCDGPVSSVCLFSEVALEQVSEVLLDYQSRTSVALTRILLADYWKVNPLLTDTKSDYRLQIKGATAGLVIGDRAIEQRQISPYIYDLGEAWKNYTGLPFVFAAWISRKKLDPSFVDMFNEANRYGIEHIDEVVKTNPYPSFDLKNYYTKFISYSLDENKLKGLRHFLKLIPHIGYVHST